MNRLCGSGPGRGGHRGPRGPRRRGRPGDRRRRGEHDPRAVRACRRPARRGRAPPRCYDTTIGWRFVNPVMRERYGTDSMPETAENVAARARRLPGRPGRVRAALAAARGQGARRRPAGQGDRRRCRCRSAKARPVPWSTSTSTRARPRWRRWRRLRPLFPGRHRHRRQLVGHQRRRRRAAGRLRGGRAPLRPGRRSPGSTAGAVAGVAPRVMGIGPVPATRKLLARAGLGVGRPRRDRAERGVRRAGPGRAARASACPTTPSTSTRTAARSRSGHPLGASGARLALTAALELHDRGARRALATMCIGVGQGIAVLLEAA